MCQADLVHQQECVIIKEKRRVVQPSTESVNALTQFLCRIKTVLLAVIREGANQHSNYKGSQLAHKSSLLNIVPRQSSHTGERKKREKLQRNSL